MIRFNKNIIITFLGPDGSGKTTLIKKVEKHLLLKKINVSIFHLKPFFFKNINTKIVNNPHNQIPRSKLFSFMKLCYWLLLYNFFFLISFIRPRKIYLFDRYADDILIDPIRYRFNLDKKLTTFILNLFPRPDLWIILNIKPNIIWKRKQEIKYKVLLKQIKNYKKFAIKKKNSILFSDNTNIQIIKDYIFKK